LGSSEKVKLLLDTHTWLWYILGDVRLPKNHRQMMEDRTAELWLSAISVWEAHLLIERGRLPVNQGASEWIQSALVVLPVREAPVTFSVAMASRSVGLSHDDPADRFIAATAIEGKLRLLTSDERMLACKTVPCVAPRRR
jgi:PIN domain nuclease of toxin-antitoxin system